MNDLEKAAQKYRTAHRIYMQTRGLVQKTDEYLFTGPREKADEAKVVRALDREAYEFLRKAENTLRLAALDDVQDDPKPKCTFCHDKRERQGDGSLYCPVCRALEEE